MDAYGLRAVLAQVKLSGRTREGVREDLIAGSWSSAERQRKSVCRDEVDRVGRNREVGQRASAGRSHLGIDHECQAAGGLVDLEDRDIAAIGG